jgi:protein-S-isoprenylcysteine O-methyltransferase Ste14
VIFWAQRASHISTKARLADDRTHEAFSVGPYAFLRTPTQTSLFLLMFGLGLVVDILWISIFAILSLIINYIIFVKKQDKILLKRYGASYEKYRSKVRF